jgi:glycine betaine/proline transport system substrate-binding protein
MKVQEIVGMALADAAKAEAEAAMMMEEDRPTIVFADLSWPSAQLQNAIARFIVENGYQYPTDAEFGDTVPLFQGLLRGDIDVTMEIWLPNQNNVWEPALASGDVIPVGKSLDDNWQSAFVVPSYVVEQNPGLVSVDDLMEHLDVINFPTEGDKTILWTCLTGWACHAVNADQVVSYGLDEDLLLKAPGSSAALFASLYGAVEKQEPWLGYLWGPTQPAAELDLTLLEEPTCAAGQEPNDGCGYAVAQVRIAVHPSMITKAPDIIEFLRKWDFTAAANVAADGYIAQTGADFPEAAIWFLENQQDVWTQWVPQDVADNVRAALSAQPG